MFIVIGCFAFLLNALFVAAYYYTGRSLKECRNYVFCLVVAGFTCMQFPLGTGLGVCTFIVLFRPSVKLKFNRYV